MRSMLAVACIAALTGCAIVVANDDVQMHSVFNSNAVAGNGVLAHDVRQVGTVSGLEVGGPLEVNVRVGQATSLAVDADSNLLPLIRSDVSGGVLRVWVEGAVRSSNNMRVTYTTPSLTQLRQSGSGQINAHGLRMGAARVDQSGSGRTGLGPVQGNDLSLTVSGSGSVQASGAVNSVNARSSGSGAIDITGVASEQADLSTSGSGSISATVKRSVLAQTSGSGHITVYGNPAQRQLTGKNVTVLN